MYWIKIAELDDKNKEMLRSYWKKVWPSAYVDALLGKQNKKKRKIRAHDKVVFKHNDRKTIGKVINIIQDKASIATDDFIHIVSLSNIEFYTGG